MSTTWTNVNGGATVIPSDPGWVSYTITSDNNPLVLTWPDSVLTTLNNSIASSIDLQTSLGSAAAIMPDATQASPGYTIIIQNTGAANITIVDANGGFLVTIAPTQALYFQLTDNTTIAGVWNIIIFGAGTASANASALAGLGLIAFNSKLNTQLPIVTVDNTFTPTVNNRATFFIYTGGTASCFVPDPSTTNIGDGYFFAISNTSTIGGILTVVNNFGYIDSPGETTLAINPGSSTYLISDGGGNYFTLGIGTETFFTYASLNLNVSGSGTLNLTDEQGTRQIINFTGTLTGSRTIVFPNFIYEWQVANLTSGSFPLTIEANGGSNVITLGQGERYIVTNDGTDMFLYPTTATALGNLTFILQTADVLLAPNAQSLGALASGIVKNTSANGTGVLSIATPGTDYLVNPVPEIIFQKNSVVSAPANGAVLQADTNNSVLFTFPNTDLRLYVDANSNYGFGTSAFTFGTSTNNLVAGAASTAFTTGSNNLTITPGTGIAITTGAGNVSLGVEAGESTTTGNQNVGVGVAALAANVGGNDNTAIGHRTLVLTVNSNNNTAVGAFAGTSLPDGSTDCTFIGTDADQTGGNALTNSTAIGFNAKVSESDTCVLGAGQNVVIGDTTAPYALSINNNNGILPAFWMNKNAAAPNAPTNGGVMQFDTNNSVLFTFPSETISLYVDANSNYWFGADNHNFGSGIQNYVAGTTSINFTNGATANVVITPGSTSALTSGSGNINIGAGAGANTSSGITNVAIGENALEANITGTANVGIGNQALQLITNTSNNTAVGSAAGATLPVGSSDCLFLGTGADQIGGNALNSAVAIGYNANVSTSNTIVLGNGQHVVIGATTYAANTSEALNLRSGFSSAGISFDTSGTRTPPATGAVLFCDTTDNLAVASTVIPNTYANIDIHPQPYFYVSPTTPLSLTCATGGVVEWPFSTVSANLVNILNNGYPSPLGSLYPNAILVVEQTFDFVNTAGSFNDLIWTAQLYYKVGAGSAVLAPGTPAITLVDMGSESGVNLTFKTVYIRISCLLSDIVNAGATQWGVAITNLGVPTLIFDSTVEPLNCYIITGGIN